MGYEFWEDQYHEEQFRKTQELYRERYETPLRKEIDSLKAQLEKKELALKEARDAEAEMTGKWASALEEFQFERDVRRRVEAENRELRGQLEKAQQIASDFGDALAILPLTPKSMVLRLDAITRQRDALKTAAGKIASRMVMTEGKYDAALSDIRRLERELEDAAEKESEAMGYARDMETGMETMMREADAAKAQVERLKGYLRQHNSIDPRTAWDRLLNDYHEQYARALAAEARVDELLAEQKKDHGCIQAMREQIELRDRNMATCQETVDQLQSVATAAIEWRTDDVKYKRQLADTVDQYVVGTARSSIVKVTGDPSAFAYSIPICPECQHPYEQFVPECPSDTHRRATKAMNEQRERFLNQSECGD